MSVWQSHLFVGQPVESFKQARQLLQQLGIPDPGPDPMPQEYDGVTVSIQFQGQTYDLPLEFAEELGSQGGSLDQAVPPDTWALVGVRLTSRYQPTLLDDRPGGESGRWNPFPVELEVLSQIRDQVRQQLEWPEAEVFMLDMHH